MTDVRVVVADTDGLRADAFDVRRVVFVDEQAVDPDLEWDDWDDDAATTHLVAYDPTMDADAAAAEGARGAPVGAARLRPSAVDDTGEPTPDAAGKVERVAVLDSHRGTGVGRALMDDLEAIGRDRGFDRFVLHSQTHAAGFYERLGYERVGDEFDEAGIPHVEMHKDA
jgi:predicted GNAT family N-acyltransferase